MDDRQGYVKLWRKIQDNEFWKEKRHFSKMEAWLDIIMETQHSETPHNVSLGMNVLTCYRGESLKSMDTWARRWRWSKSKVGRFFRLLVKQKMISLKSETVTTRIKVCNYNLYNPLRNANETQSERSRNASESQVEPDNNDKNEKNGKKKSVRKQFVKPTPEEVDEYTRSIGYKLSGKRFCDANEGKGWLVGKNQTPMQDWKAVVRTWKHNEEEKQTPKRYGPSLL